MVKLNETSFAQYVDVQYYKKYFNISTLSAVDRTLKALWPFRNETFLESETEPDLYVPFWNFVTLVLTMSVLSNVFSGTDDSKELSKIVHCFTAFGLYLCINPIVVFFVLRFKGANVSLPSLAAVYGYSLVIYSAVSIPYLLPYKFFRFLLLAGASGISLYFLERNLGSACDKYLERNAVFARVYAVCAKLMLLYAICFRIH